LAGALGDLCVRQSTKISQFKDFAMLSGQLPQNGTHLVQIYPIVPFAISRFSDRYVRVVEIRFFAVFPDVVNRPMTGYYREPRSEKTALRIARFWLTPQVQKDFLGNVFCGLDIANDMTGDRKYKSRVSIIDLQQGIGVPVEQSFYQRNVIETIRQAYLL
jgi:hypothetical protein